MENEEPQSPEEIKLREWLNEHDVFRGDMEMQSLVLNSFYSEVKEPQDDGDLSMDPQDYIAMLKELIENEPGTEGEFDYRQYEKSDEEEEADWQVRVSYALNNPEQFLTYINENWRGF